MLLAAACAAVVRADSPGVPSTDALSPPESTGIFTFSGLHFALFYLNKKSTAVQSSLTPDNDDCATDHIVWTTVGRLDVPAGGAFTVTQRVEKVNRDTAVVNVMVWSDKPIDTDYLAETVTLPGAYYAGRGLSYNKGPDEYLPAEPRDNVVLWKPHISSIRIPTADGGAIEVTGDELSTCVADERKWKQPQFSMRLLFKPDHGPIKAAMLSFKLHRVKPADGK